MSAGYHKNWLPLRTSLHKSVAVRRQHDVGAIILPALVSCSPVLTGFHERLTALAFKLMQDWRERTVSKVVLGDLETSRLSDPRNPSKGANTNRCAPTVKF